MRLHKLSPEEKKQLKEYAESLKEIKKCINEILKKANLKVKALEEEGGNMSTGLFLDPNKLDQTSL